MYVQIHFQDQSFKTFKFDRNTTIKLLREQICEKLELKELENNFYLVEHTPNGRRLLSDIDLVSDLLKSWPGGQDLLHPDYFMRFQMIYYQQIDLTKLNEQTLQFICLEIPTLLQQLTVENEPVLAKIVAYCIYLQYGQYTDLRYQAINDEILMNFLPSITYYDFDRFFAIKQQILSIYQKMQQISQESVIKTIVTTYSTLENAFCSFFTVKMINKNDEVLQKTVLFGVSQSSILIFNTNKELILNVQFQNVSQWGIADNTLVLTTDENSKIVEYVFETGEAEFIGQIIEGNTIRLLAESAI